MFVFIMILSSVKSLHLIYTNGLYPEIAKYAALVLIKLRLRLRSLFCLQQFASFSLLCAPDWNKKEPKMVRVWFMFTKHWNGPTTALQNQDFEACTMLNQG